MYEVRIAKRTTGAKGCKSIQYLQFFLHSPFCKAEGLCQQAAIKLGRGGVTPREPITVKQTSQGSAVIGRSQRV